MDTLNHPPLNMALCADHEHILATVKERLAEMGPLPTEPLTVWEESLGMKNYTSDLVDDLRDGDFDIEEFIHKAMDVAVCALRLSNALARQDLEVSA